MNTGSFSRIGLAAILGLLPTSAYAQHVPTWLIAGVLSPVLVLFLCVVLGLLTRSVKIGVRHAVFILAWVVLFLLTSFFVENDYVIWTPLLLYLVHSALLVVLIVVQTVKRIAGVPSNKENPDNAAKRLD